MASLFTRIYKCLRTPTVAPSFKPQLPAMTLQTHCINCFQPITNAGKCRNCSFNLSNAYGFDAKGKCVNSEILPPFTDLAEGRYRTGRVLGRPGGFGIVYAGFQASLQRAVAIKEYFPFGNNLAQRDSETSHIIPEAKKLKVFKLWQEQFIKESQILSSLHHPQIVSICDLIEANGTMYMILERLDGVTLTEYMGGQQRTPHGVNFGQRLLPQIVSKLMHAAIKALEVLHENPKNPIMHLDLNPNNIFIRANNPENLTLLDFGLARRIDNPIPKELDLSAGNPDFMAPEQRGKNAKITLAADYYSLGASMYAAITGSLPYPTAAQLSSGSIALPDIRGQFHGADKNLAATIMACVELDPQRRPRSIQDIRNRLNTPVPSSNQVSPIIPPHITPNTPGDPKKPSGPKPHNLVFLKLFVVIILLIILALFAIAWVDPEWWEFWKIQLPKWYAVLKATSANYIKWLQRYFS
ncbi:hypothetical protein TI04_03330 [Achromatium sp. WMS2]|nr:hypothetical protein TI04_03330 [Achromatium sp. WMS2]